VRKKKVLPAPLDLIDPDASLDDLRDAVQQCRGCDIWQKVLYWIGPVILSLSTSRGPLPSVIAYTDAARTRFKR
jgi:hypothetical protein